MHKRESALWTVSSDRNRWRQGKTAATLEELGKLRPTSNWCSMPVHKRGSGFFRSLALMAAGGLHGHLARPRWKVLYLIGTGPSKSTFWRTSDEQTDNE